jgi:hypothetical protein
MTLTCSVVVQEQGDLQRNITLNVDVPGLPMTGFTGGSPLKDDTDDPSEEPEERNEVENRGLWGVPSGLQRNFALDVREGSLGVEVILALLAHA